MSLPFSFANVTTLVTSQIDANFNAVGALTPIPCVASGTNTISLVQEANTPTVTAYSNYMQFTGVAAATNTGASTGAVGGLSALNIYKDTIAGPVLLTGGEIIINCQFTLIYDSALNLGNGGFRLVSAANNVLATGGTITGAVTFSAAAVFNSIATFLSGASVSALLQTGSLMVAAGASVTSILSTTSSVTWPNIPAQTSTFATILLPGASLGDCVIIGAPSSIPVGINFFGHVGAAGSVALRCLNITAASITPPAATYRVTTQRFAP